MDKYMKYFFLYTKTIPKGVSSKTVYFLAVFFPEHKPNWWKSQKRRWQSCLFYQWTCFPEDPLWLGYAKKKDTICMEDHCMLNVFRTFWILHLDKLIFYGHYCCCFGYLDLITTSDRNVNLLVRRAWKQNRNPCFTRWLARPLNNGFWQRICSFGGTNKIAIKNIYILFSIATDHKE